MPLYTLAGTPVDFPHAAYGTQLVLMAKVVTAADAGAHALLEAPTGSGKTLALLCAALAWQAKEKDEDALSSSSRRQQRKPAKRPWLQWSAARSASACR